MILNLLRNRINRCTVEAIIKTISNRYKNKILTVQFHFNLQYIFYVYYLR